MALYFALQFGVMLVLGFLYAFVMAVASSLRGEHFSGQQIVQSFRDPAVTTLGAVGAILVAAGLMFWLCHRFWPLQWRASNPPGFGFAWPRKGWWFAVAIAVGLGVVLFNSVLTQWLAQGQELQQDVTKMGLEVGIGPRLALGAIVVLVAPLVEELLFRGVLLSGLMRRMPVFWAVLATALLFGGVHLPDFKFAWFPIPGLVLFGALLAWLRLRSGSLWVSITAHASNNLVGVVAWFVMAAARH